MNEEIQLTAFYTRFGGEKTRQMFSWKEVVVVRKARQQIGHQVFIIIAVDYLFFHGDLLGGLFLFGAIGNAAS